MVDVMMNRTIIKFRAYTANKDIEGKIKIVVFYIEE